MGTCFSGFGAAGASTGDAGLRVASGAVAEVTFVATGTSGELRPRPLRLLSATTVRAASHHAGCAATGVLVVQADRALPTKYGYFQRRLSLLVAGVDPLTGVRSAPPRVVRTEPAARRTAASARGPAPGPQQARSTVCCRRHPSGWCCVPRSPVPSDCP